MKRSDTDEQLTRLIQSKQYYYLVVYICNVLDIIDVEFKVVLHDPPYDIGRNIISCMTKMGVTALN